MFTNGKKKNKKNTEEEEEEGYLETSSSFALPRDYNADLLLKKSKAGEAAAAALLNQNGCDRNRGATCRLA